MWRWLRGTGLERFELVSGRTGWTLRGTILTLSGQQPVEVRYEVACDAAWRTTQTHIALFERGRERSLDLVVEDDRWYQRGRENRAVRGCVDVDLGWSPSTNTLPIRRLKLKVGDSSGQLNMAWVRFPELEVELLPQEYRRLSKRRYRYASRRGSFTAEIQVDEAGLVVDYNGFWGRVLSSRR
jgi:hypothetical protein